MVPSDLKTTKRNRSTLSPMPGCRVSRFPAIMSLDTRDSRMNSAMCRGVVRPEHVDQPIDRDRPLARQREDLQERARLPTAEPLISIPRRKAWRLSFNKKAVVSGVGK